MPENMETEVVISGMSGRFPDADNAVEFYEKLINKDDLISENDKRIKPGIFGLPKRFGKLKDLSKFDNQFFGFNSEETHELDPQARILLEVTYEAIVDAGYDPCELRGKKIGVFLGICFNEAFSMACAVKDIEKFNGHAVLDNGKACLSSRISHVFDFKGPCFNLDMACSSSAMALYEAFQAIRTGDCEAAVVGGSNLILMPDTSIAFQTLNMNSDDGKSKSFDISGDGYVRSEAIATIFLQRSDDARRNYASIDSIKANNDGFKIEGPTYPSCEMQKRLMSEALKGCHFDPRKISYLEAHATGTPAGDLVEMAAIADVFCPGREEPLLIGSVKSNSGHPEPVSAIIQLVKLLLSMERGLLPPNMHFNEPHPEIIAFSDGRVKVVTEPTPWCGPYTAFNSFGFGGGNVHCILKSNLVTPLPESKKGNVIPQLVFYCGRTKDSVQSVFNSTELKEAPREFFALLHKLSYTSPKMKPYRGYKLIGVEEDIQDTQLIPHDKRQLWYVFSGMGSEVPPVPKDFFEIEVFAKSLQKSAEVLKPFELNLIDMVTSKLTSDASKDCKANEKSIVPAIISIAAVQVAFVDVFNELGLKPDGIIGHSLGELGCAYADGCLTAQQVLLASYWIAKAIEDSDLISGAMEKLRLTDNVKDDVSGRDVKACNNADLWECISPAAEKIQLLMEKVIPDPKLRSSRWISSPYPADKCHQPEAKVASALYFMRNLVSPVNFEDKLRYIPKNAIVIEIGSHDLLDAIRKKNIEPDASYFSFMKEDENSVVNLLSSIGKLYISGLDPDIEKLYPSVTFPVPRSTPMISPLMKWDHSETWDVHKWNEDIWSPVIPYKVQPGPVDSHDRYLLGHCIDGRLLFPASGYIYLIWKLFTNLKLPDHANLVPVQFENVKFMRATLLSEINDTKFIAHLSLASGAFEISESGTPVCTGFVSSPMEKDKKCITRDTDIDKESLTLNMKDIYKELKLRGYEYGPTFQGIMASNLSGSEGILKWNDNWVVYLDTLFQFSLISSNRRVLLIPIGIESLTVYPMEHMKLAEKALKEYQGIPVKYDAQTQEYFSAGVYAKNVKVGFQKKRPDNQLPLLEQYKFAPYEMCFTSKAHSSLYEEYLDVCESLSRKISELFQQKTDQINDHVHPLILRDELMDKYQKSEENCYVLFKCLMGIMNASNDQGLSQIIKEHVNNYIRDLENDTLSQILLNESSLRIAFDVVLENLVSRKINVVEISAGSHTLASKFQEYISIPGSYVISYSILHCNAELLCKDHLPPNADIIKWESKSSIGFQNVDIVVLNYLKFSASEIEIILENAVACLKNEGFIFLLVKTKLVPPEMILSSIGNVSIPSIEENYLEQLFKVMNLNVICKIIDPFTSTLFLLRKSAVPSFQDSIIHLTFGEYNWVDDLKQKIVLSRKLQDSSCPQRIWIVSEDSCYSGILGLVNCLRREPGGSDIRCVFTEKDTSNIPKFSLTDPFYTKQLEKNLVMNVLQNGSWGSYRHFRCEEDSSTAKTEQAFLDVMTIGDLSSLVWIPLSLNNMTLTDNAIICHVYYASLNFKDVMLATGRVPLAAVSGTVSLKNSLVGFEFSGRTFDGRRVMGIVSHNAMATTVVANRTLLWDVPDEWSLEQAATVPVVYATAYYALISRGRLQKGERVLIHSGSGGVGQAAIILALSLGCDVYTTVGSEEKKKFLKQKFPQLPEEHIYNSRDTRFEQQILHATKGEGVHVVLNSLAGDKLFASLNCLAVGGRFLEIGKFDLAMNNKLGMAIFLKNVSFQGIFLDTRFHDPESKMSKDLFQLLKEGIESGVIKPLNSTVFNHDQAEQAFRYMAGGRHIGKVVLKIRDEEREKKAIPSPISVTAIKRTTFDSKKSYLIIGGLGGIGLELCQWLINRGAKNVILTSRSGITTGYQKLCLQRWKQDLVNVVISKLNVVKSSEARNLLMLAAKLGPVGGIFNLAMVLRDVVMENQTVQNFIDVCECKVEATKNLDLLTRELCPDLDWFVCFSSLSCGRGNYSQSNYGYANSVMERICEDRVSKGLPGLAIQWGMIGDVGIVEDTHGSDVLFHGTVAQKISSCLSVLDTFLQQRHPVVSSFVPYHPDETEKEMAKGDLLSYMANIFGIKDVSSINPEAALSELGMDSLISIELKQILEVNFDTVLSLPELQKLRVKDLKIIADKETINRAQKSFKFELTDVEILFGNYHALTNMNLLPTDTLIPMNAITEGLPLFIIHTIEGSVTSLRSLAKEMSCPVYGIQSTVEAPRDSIESLAAWYWKHLKTIINPTQTINLAGYSFGAVIAFEMASQQEQDPNNYPEIKNLSFLDGSHIFLRKLLHTISTRSDKVMENVTDQVVFLNIFSRMFFDEVILDKKELFNLKSSSERIHYTTSKIASVCPHFNFDYIQTMFDQFSSKLQMAFEYNPNYKLKRDVYLFKASKSRDLRKLLSDVYDLDLICEGKIISHVIEGNHYTFLQDNSAKEVANLLKEIFNLK